MKSKFIPIAVCITIFVLCASLYNPQALEAFSVTGALCVSGVALWYAKKELEHHKKNDKTNLLCQYLHRYANDKFITRIVCYINDVALLDESGNIIGFDSNKEIKCPPTQREKEMFMHFYEEIQMLIESDMMEKSTAIDLMGYYCGIFHRIKEFHQDLTDYYDERYWKKYLTFANSIPDDYYAIKK